MRDSAKYIQRKHSKQIVSAEQLMNTSIIPSQIQIFVQTNTGLRAFLFSSLYSDTQNTTRMKENQSKKLFERPQRSVMMTQSWHKSNLTLLYRKFFGSMHCNFSPVHFCRCFLTRLDKNYTYDIKYNILILSSGTAYSLILLQKKSSFIIYTWVHSTISKRLH